MESIRKLSLLLMVVSCLSSGVMAAEDLSPVKIGLIHFAPPLSKDMDFTPTLRVLQEKLYPRQVQAKVFSSKDLEQAIKNGEIDFFFASSGFFWRMLPFGVRDIATVVTKEKPQPNFGTAGAFVTLKNRTDVNSLEDMKGKRFMANYETAFHGYRTGMAELQANGFDYEHFFSSVKFVGENSHKLIDAVLKDETDIIYLRACWIEEFEQHNVPLLDKLKVIAPRQGPVACIHSTRYYPNNTFASTRAVDHELARAVSVALLSMPKASETHSWSMATDFKPVDDLYKSLRVGPYEYLRHWDIKRIWNEFWPLVILCIFGIFGLVAHGWRTSQLVEQRTAELTQETNRRKEVEAKAHQLTEKMESQQKLNMVGQLSSMFAHEMNQPLAACTYFVEGLKSLLENKKFDRTSFLYGISELDNQLKRATQIVKRVRLYAKRQATRTEIVQLSFICQDILKTMQVRYSGRVSINYEIESGLIVTGDALECQLLVWNLFKNSVEASLEETDPRVFIRLVRTENNTITLEMKNSGVQLSDEQVSKIGEKILESKKEGGLGLGVAVVKSITESMGAKFMMNPNKDGGLTAKVIFDARDKGSPK